MLLAAIIKIQEKLPELIRRFNIGEKPESAHFYPTKDKYQCGIVRIPAIEVHIGEVHMNTGYVFTFDAINGKLMFGEQEYIHDGDFGLSLINGLSET